MSRPRWRGETRTRHESRLLVLALALRAIRWRAAASLTVFVVAVIAILAATVGPIYLHAVDETVLTTHLARASPYQRDVLISRDTLLGYPHADWEGQVRTLTDQVERDPAFGAPVTENRFTISYGGGSPPSSAQLASISGLCAHVHIITGRCLSPESTGATLISASTAASEHLAVGGTFAARANNGTSVRLTVAGVYRPIAPRGPYWAPWNLFGAGQPSLTGHPPGDAAFVGAAELATLVNRVPQTLSANVPLRPAAVAYGDIATLRRTVGRLHDVALHLGLGASSSGISVATVTTSLPTILGDAARESSLARTLITVTTVQLALLAILVLYAVVANTALAQGPEVALAKLRGRRTGSVLLQSVAQPVVLVLLAAPVAALLAWILVRAVAPRLLGHPVAVTFPPGAFAVAALATAGGILAAGVAARRIVVTPVGALMRRGAAASGSSVGLLLADSAVVALAVAGLVELDAGGVLDARRPNPLSILAPTLLAIAAGVLALRLLPLVARRLAGWTRDSRWLATFLAVRQLLRRPAEVRAVLLVAVALSITAFAVTNWADASHNRSLRALNAAGADTVLMVRPGPHVDDLRTAVDRADPSGQAMAVAYTNVDGLPPLIAVDTARFPAVGAWVRGNAPAPLRSVLHQIAGEPPVPVTVTGTRLRLRIDLTRHPPGPVRLALNLNQPDHDPVGRTIARVGPGRRVYDVTLPSACAAGCRLTTLGLTANPPQPGGFTTRTWAIGAVIGASVRAGAAWKPVSGFGDPRRWRGNGTGPLTVGDDGGSLALDLRLPAGASAWPTVISAAVPTALPAVVGSARAALYRGDEIHSALAVGLDGQTVSIDGVVRSVTLPQVDRDGMMVSLGTALAAMRTNVAATTHDQVWLSPSAPADMVARLARQGVTVTRTVRASTYRAEIDDSGSAFADSLSLMAALAATILAIGATAVGRMVSVRRRAYEFAALETVGVSARALRRATAAEQGSVFAIGLVIGLAAGLIGARLALPSTPVFIDTATGPPLVLGLPWALLAALAAGLVVVFAVVSLAIARLVDRSATPGQLRGAQQ